MTIMHQPSGRQGRPSKVGKMLTGEPIAALLIKVCIEDFQISAKIEIT